jgi:hypothetical protein
MLASITGFERSHFKAIEWSINEITDNVLVHSESSLGGLVQLTAMKNTKKVEFVVCDNGIGIPKSLRSSGLTIGSDVDALVGFLEGNKVVVDFVDIHLVSSSFADEVFGKLFLDLGPIDFSNKLQLKNMDATVKLLVEKAITQRMAGPRIK